MDLCDKPNNKIPEIGFNEWIGNVDNKDEVQFNLDARKSINDIVNIDNKVFYSSM